MSMLNTIKHHGRKYVLPVEEIKTSIKSLVIENQIKNIVDFGAGTLFWSKWFANNQGLKVTAVDITYMENPPKNDNESIVICSDIVELLEKKQEDNSIMFICYVIHHLPPDFWHTVFHQITEQFDYIFIKDIDGNSRFGNFCNKMHDRIINGETINDVYPDKIEKHLTDTGFTVQLKALPKLWYPHFSISAVRNTTVNS